MSQNQKSIVITKAQADALSGVNKEAGIVEPGNEVKPIEEAVVATTKDKKSKKDVEEHIFGTAEKTDTFAEKSAEAAANAALKAAINANSEISMREAEKMYFKEKKDHMLKRCKEDEVVPVTVPKLYAPFIGKVYTFLYNGIPVTVYCDDKAHEYPKFIADKINEKLARISESNTYKDITDKLTEDTY